VEDHRELYNDKTRQCDILIVETRLFSVPMLMALANELPVAPWTLEHFKQDVRDHMMTPCWYAGQNEDGTERILPPISMLNPENMFLATIHPGIAYHFVRMFQCDLSNPVIMYPTGHCIDGKHRIARLFFAWMHCMSRLEPKKPSIITPGQNKQQTMPDEEGAFNLLVSILKPFPPGFIKFESVDQMLPAMIAECDDPNDGATIHGMGKEATERITKAFA